MYVLQGKAETTSLIQLPNTERSFIKLTLNQTDKRSNSRLFLHLVLELYPSMKIAFNLRKKILCSPLTYSKK